MNGTGCHDLVRKLTKSQATSSIRVTLSFRKLRPVVAQKKKPQKGPFHWGDVVEDVRTVFEEMDDATLFLPTFLTTFDIIK